MRIVVTGAKGMLGNDLIEALADNHQVIGVDIEDVDLSQVQAISFLISSRPDLIIHTAAYTDVDGCERNPEQGFRVNALGTKHVAKVCQVLNIPLVYLSTDYVFDGTKQEPYTESDVPNPLSAYGRSKLEGEKFIESVLKTGRFYIVRTAWLYGKHGRNFVKVILEKAQRGEALQVVDDQVGSPTYAMDLAKAIMSLIDDAPFGTYHITNSGSCSWYEFAGTILTLAGLKQCRLTPISSQDLGRIAPRPSNSVLANDNWRKIAGQDLRSWQDALNESIYTDSQWKLF